MEQLTISATFGFPIACAATDREGRARATGRVEEVFPLASVTKLFAAYTVLVEIEKGTLALDDPAGPEGSTVRHLLAHASGLASDGPSTLAAPGARRVYSNQGFEVLADHAEQAAGASFGGLLARDVTEPLGLSSVMLDGSAAKDGSGTVADLVAFGWELLDPTLVGPELMRAATRVQFEGLTGVLPGYGRQQHNDWGLGFELKADKQPHWTGAGNAPSTFGHFGQSGSFLWVDPEHGRAGAFLGAAPFGEEHQRAWPGLSDELLAAEL